jgi:uncharacterized protein (TIGR03792 family)
MNGIRRHLAIGAILAGLLTSLMVFHPPAAGALPPPLEPIPQAATTPGAAPGSAVGIDPEPAPPTAAWEAVATMGSEPATTVVEMLRLHVPAVARQAWLAAERDCWDPWLRHQAGFLSRELLWDGERQEGVVMIRWASPALWHAIPQEEIDRVQRRFEEIANRALGRSGGEPFPLLASGSLQPQPQGRT